MRYPASEKLEIIRLVEASHLSARQTLAKLGIPRTTFYRWYDRYLQRGEAGLEDRSPKPKHVWNRVPDEVKRKVVDFALQETELSPRELAVTFTDQERYFVSDVRRQGFRDQWLPKLRESLAHLVGLIMRRAGGDASGAFRVSSV
jgi:putative transposase